MNFSVMIWPHSGETIEPVVELARIVEDLGFDTVYVGDSQMIWNDVWICLACCAMGTKRVKLGTGVTNVLTRHPTVTANSITSLNILSKGRAVLGVGAGDSAVRTAGLSPAKMGELFESLQFIRALLSGKEVELPRSAQVMQKTWGRETKLRLVGAERWGRGIPLEVAVMTPDAVEKMAEIADGIIVDGHMGGNTEGATAAVAAVARGAQRAGRHPSSIRLISAIDTAVDNDRRHALDRVRATAARNIARKRWLPRTLGVDHADVVRQVTESYRFYQHLDLSAEHRRLIPDEVAIKVTLAGTPDDCIAKVRDLDRAGVTDIALLITAQDKEGSRRTLERFAREVIPHV